ncbi:hypothetical protein MHOL44478_04460 [Mycobacterium holsaticum DSM 44478]|nr:hypothetical protein [Mycolicibacterium holsaticum DSM 44478 = JCM 12374]
MSVDEGSVAHMFDTLSDAELVDFMGEKAREESAALGRRLAAVGELFARRERDYQEAKFYFTDVVAAVAAEISPIHNISHARAVAQVGLARTLRERLPRIAKVLIAGLIDYRMVATIIHRTHNVDDALIGDLDEALARRVHQWMKLSTPKLRDRLDMWVAKYDPAAVRVPPKVDEDRCVEIHPSDTAGIAIVWGTLHAADAAAVDQRLDALAATVCENDPRTKRQRRADACGPLGRGEATLACKCGSPDCRARTTRDAAAAAVIHVLAEQSTLQGTAHTPGYLPGFGVLPAESVRELAASATLKALTVPTGTAPDPGYRPSAKTTEFIAWRDLSCRWPGCDRPAQRCDVDHTAPWPAGPTHPSNTKLYCRTHHLIKTFLTGPRGWHDQQMPDGTVVLTSPTGHTYRNTPHGAAMFPTLAQPTGQLNLPTQPPPPHPDRLAMMPRRRQTREQDRRDRITAERRQRSELIAEEERQRQAWLAANYQPPPF